jgi:hypothetical protein
MIIFTVTVVDVVSDPVLGVRRTPGIFTDLNQALFAVRNNEGNISDNGQYQYAVIEETLLNELCPYLLDGQRLWFKYNSIRDEYEPCSPDKVPNKLARLVGFGIG